MEIYILIIVLIVGFVLVLKKLENNSKSNNSYEEIITKINTLNTDLSNAKVEIETKNKAVVDTFKDQRAEMQNAAKELIGTSLKYQVDTFKDGTKKVSDSVGDQTTKFNEKMVEMETIIKGLDSTQNNLKDNIQKFNVIMSSSQQSGKLGEFQLGNMFHKHNLVENNDYIMQPSVTLSDKKTIYRPDAILISKDSCLVIDSKATSIPEVRKLSEEHLTEEEIERIKEKIKKNVKTEASALSKKQYQELEFDGKRQPQFYVMFTPLDSVYQIAKELIQRDSGKIEDNVILAGPEHLSFIILMWANLNVAIKIQKNFDQIKDIADGIFSHYANSTERLNKMRNSLNDSVEHWNKFVTSVDVSLLSQVKKFEKIAIKKENLIDQQESIANQPNELKKLKDHNDTKEQSRIES